MRVFQLENNWSVDDLKITERPKPKPGPGQLLLKIKAVSLNYRDLVVLKRGYGALTGQLPLIPISDGVGEIVDIGKGIDSNMIGKRVCPLFMPKWIDGKPTKEKITSTLGGPLDGLMSDYLVINEESVVEVPDYLSDLEASTLPCAALTAWSSLVTEGNIVKGDSVLIQGTGGVSIFALQFSKLLGAEIYIISSNEKKLIKSYNLGADFGMNYVNTPGWGKEINNMTAGSGIDHIIEVGGKETLPQSLRAIRPGGTLSLIGVLSGTEINVNLGLIVTRKIKLQGITVGNKQGFKEMIRFISKHKIKPVIDKVFQFEQLPEALNYLASGQHFGKICIRHK